MNEHRIREIVREEIAKAREADARAVTRSLQAARDSNPYLFDPAKSHDDPFVASQPLPTDSVEIDIDGSEKWPKLGD